MCPAADTQVAKVVARFHSGGKGAQRQDRARSSNHALRLPARQSLQVGRHLTADVPDEPPLVVARQRIGPHEAFGQPDDAQLEAARGLNGVCGAKRDLDAAAADVDHHRPGAADIRPVDGGLMNQPGLVGAGDDAGADSGFVLDSREELAAVSCFAGGTGRGGEHDIHLARLGEALEFDQRLQRRLHPLARQRPAVEAAGAKPDHGLLAVDDLEREVRPHAHNDHVDGVGTDVDGCKTHVV